MKRWISEKRRVLQFVLALVIWASSPVFGDIFPYERSAKPLGKSNLELMSTYSAFVTSIFEESDHYANQYDMQAGYGLGQNFDFQFRYGLRQYLIGNDDRLRHQVAFGPKLAMLKDRLAIRLPVSFLAGEYIRTSESWELLPTLFFTQKIEQISELNGSITAIILLNRRDDDIFNQNDVFVALNLGMGLYLIPDRLALMSEIEMRKKLSRLGRSGLSRTAVRIAARINLTDKWVLRPELGLGVGNYLSHFGVGITYYP